MVSGEYRIEWVPGAIGALASLTAVGGGLGIVLAGPIVDALDYHWLFWLPMILTVAAAVAAVLFVPESPVRTAGRISWLPAVLLSAWLVALLVALSEAPEWGWGSGRILGLLAAAVVLAAGWVTTELRAAVPLIDMKMMRRTAVWANNLVSLLLGVGMYATFAFLPGSSRRRPRPGTASAPASPAPGSCCSRRRSPCSSPACSPGDWPSGWAARPW